MRDDRLYFSFNEEDPEILFTFGNYEVIVGTYEDEGGFLSEGYGVVNKNTFVVEYRTRILPKARWFAEQFNKMLETSSIDPYVVDLSFITYQELSN